MREILFRGKRKDSGEWVEGRLLAADVIVPSGQEFSLEANCIYGCDKPIIGYEVDEETVGQFTGLKDKNGKKIFEGDIVTAPYIDPIFHSVWNEGNLTENAVVKYADGMFYIEYVESKQKITLFGLLNGAKEAAVIGNIHDNPELLKGTEQ